MLQAPFKEEQIIFRAHLLLYVLLPYVVLELWKVPMVDGRRGKFLTFEASVLFVIWRLNFNFAKGHGISTLFSFLFLRTNNSLN